MSANGMCCWSYYCTYADVATKVTVNQTRAVNILMELQHIALKLAQYFPF